MRSGVIAQKVGMTRVYNDGGEHVPVTVLKLDGCQVVAHRTKDKNGYTAVQVGTAYLFTPEARIHAVYRAALGARDRTTAITNVFSGRPARGIVNRLMRDLGAMSDLAPPFPAAADAVAPLRRAAEAAGRDDFSPLWAGESFPRAQPMSAAALTRLLGGA